MVLNFVDILIHHDLIQNFVHAIVISERMGLQIVMYNVYNI